MADNNSNPNVEKTVESIGVAPWQTGLSAVVNDTYSYANSSYFCAVIAGYYRDYAFRYIRPSVQWLDGYVPAIHWGGSGIMSTRIASSLINGITKTLVGEKLIFKALGKKDGDALDVLDFVSNWATKVNIKKAVRNAIGYTLAVGTGFLKANKRADGTVWWEGIRFDNGFYLANASNEVQDASFLLRSYTDTRKDGSSRQFYLVEHRFYQKRKPLIKKVEDPLTGKISYQTIKDNGYDAMVEYRVHSASSQSLNNMMSTYEGEKSTVGWSEIPKEIRRAIKNDYALIRIDEPTLLGFPNLGVEVLLNDEGDISLPTGSNFGRGLIVPVIDDFIIYEIAEAYMLRDMYNGKGTVYVPKALNLGSLGAGMPDIQLKATPVADGQIRSDGATVMKNPNPTAYQPTGMSPLEGMSDKYEVIPGTNPEDQAVVVNQFDLRADQWQTIQENTLRRIAIKWGMSPKVLASFLAQGTVQMTATQIDSEDDISIAFINDKRANFIGAINRLLETTLNFYGKPTNVEVQFASPSLVNKDRILDRVIKKLQAGLCTLDDAIREINPDLDEKTLQAKVDELKAEQLKQQLAALTEMNPVGGGFGNNYEDLGGANLGGSTSPVQ